METEYRIKTKFKPGDTVFALNKYPAGGRIFNTIIHDICICIDKAGIHIKYQIPERLKMPMPESSLFETMEEAEQAKQEWLNKPEVKERSDRLKNLK